MTFNEKILSEVESLIIVKDASSNIIWCNKMYIDEICNYNSKNNIIAYDNKFYERKQKKFYYNSKEYIIEEYIDVTSEIILIEKLERDKLTGLYNRHKIEIKLNEVNEYAKNNKSVFSVVIGDVDFFKKVNDTYGHLNGDYVLQFISNLLIKFVGIKGFVGRYGGEEFIIILPNISEEDTYIIMDNIREKLYYSKILLNDTNVTISMTFGITSSFGEKDLQQVLKEADDALYIGKKSGRNKTMIYNE